MKKVKKTKDKGPGTGKKSPKKTKMKGQSK